MRNVRVAADRWNFELEGTGESITPVGGNMLSPGHPVDGTLFDRFDAADCERRFALLEAHGYNCVRQAIGVNRVFDPATGLKAEGLRNWDTFIALAEKHGVYLMPVGGYVGGNDWFDVEKLADNGRSLDESCAFWEAFAGHYAGHPAIWAWDLRNELLYWARPHSVPKGHPDEQRVAAMIRDAWPAWLERRYGSVGAMNRAYSASYATFEEVPGSVEFVDRPYDLCAYDFRNYLNDRGYAWCKRQCDVIRAASPKHMVVSGNNSWLSPDQDLFLSNGFHNRAVESLFDFVTHHPYPAWQACEGGRGDPLDGGEPLRYWLNACVAMSRFDHYNKPVVIQEFGWYGGGESAFLGPLPYRTEAQHAEYMRTLVETLAPHSNGFINWPLFDMPGARDISNHGGIFTADGGEKELTKVFDDIARTHVGTRHQRLRATTTLTYSLLALYTSRDYQDRMWDEVHEVISSGHIPDFRFIA
ncbi:MAG: beta-galactosidase [Kiritimatiellia bacterium]|jgi:hypothetical protein